jgi:hypothetical protein
MFSVFIIVKLFLEDHLGHPRVTFTRQSDWALFTLGLNLAKSTSLTMQKKVANHSP